MGNTILCDYNNIALIIDWILRLVGILALIMNLILLFTKHNKDEVNVYINKIKKIDFDKYENALIYDDGNENMNGEYLLFKPQGKTSFLYVKYCECEFTGKKLVIKKEIKCFNNINSSNGLIIYTYFPCGVPSRIIQWKTEYGVKGEYVIFENGKDGDVKYGNHIYFYIINNFISNIKKIFN